MSIERYGLAGRAKGLGLCLKLADPRQGNDVEAASNLAKEVVQAFKTDKVRYYVDMLRDVLLEHLKECKLGGTGNCDTERQTFADLAKATLGDVGRDLRYEVSGAKGTQGEEKVEAIARSASDNVTA